MSSFNFNEMSSAIVELNAPFGVDSHTSIVTPLPRLPPELMDYIIDHLHKSSKELKVLGLVCRAWLISTRYHLFRTIRVLGSCKHRGQHNTPRSLNTLSKLLRTPSSTIRNCIRALTVTSKRIGSTVAEQSRVRISSLLTLLELLPNLETLKFRDVYIMDHIAMTPPHSNVCPRLHRIELHLVGASTCLPLLALIRCFRSVKSIHIHQVQVQAVSSSLLPFFSEDERIPVQEISFMDSRFGGHVHQLIEGLFPLLDRSAVEIVEIRDLNSLGNNDIRLINGFLPGIKTIKGMVPDRDEIYDDTGVRLEISPWTNLQSIIIATRSLYREELRFLKRLPSPCPLSQLAIHFHLCPNKKDYLHRTLAAKLIWAEVGQQVYHLPSLTSVHIAILWGFPWKGECEITSEEVNALQEYLQLPARCRLTIQESYDDADET
ncbi:hypothetical protein BXZ70DRAFT_459070 [Cristinia sonorae]|uniref:F-box domain-containing protein n=1 Tax=Cristinia sonorae TaxID=1940300 RepID=A0A8K0XM40_9AGAR|nr:hypothetical protein BXZ70DRAFT_459070 [Cristinia sonorae]